jgi:hypothetical protein
MSLIPQRRLPIKLLICSLMSAFLFVSCGTAPDHYRGSLSDGMDKAKDDHEGSRSVPDYERPPEQDERDIPERHRRGDRKDANDSSGSDSSDAVSDGSSSANAEPLEVWIGVRGGSSKIVSREIGTYSDGDIYLGAVTTPRFELGFFGGYHAAFPENNSPLDDSVKDPITFLKAGIEGRYAPFPAWTFMCPYVGAGAGGFIMFWTYENSLTAGPDTISGDTLPGLLLSVSAGIYPINLEHFRIGISVVPEAYLFGQFTGEGFDNDYFTSFSPLKIMGEISIKF